MNMELSYNYWPNTESSQLNKDSYTLTKYRVDIKLYLVLISLTTGDVSEVKLCLVSMTLTTT